MKIVLASNGKKKIKISKSEWENIGKKAGWTKTSNRIRYYLETWIDGKQLLGSDGTIVFKTNLISPKTIEKAIQTQTEKLVNLSKYIMPKTIKNCENITLKLVKSYGNQDTTLKEIDVTNNVKREVDDSPYDAKGDMNDNL